MPQSQTNNSTVEERIVEMRFDNKQFESGVKQTMSTLDKLKEKLVFKNDVKGLDNIQNSINRIDLSVAMRGIDAFQQKLSALQIFGKRIVENLADDFYGEIMKVKNAIDGVFKQISTGGANRALNIEQAKFQLQGLHIAWEDIKGDIDYAVSGTAYGLDAAARVAAQLSASQVQVGDDMKAALRGISGVAAMTNSSYEEIGRIFSQVAGAGRLYTQDMLQMSSRGLNIAAALGQQLGHTEAEIREMVTKGQIDFKTFATAMNEAFGEQATKANDTYTGSLSNVKAALSRLGADIKAGHFETFRQVFVDLIPKINEFKKAFKPIEELIIKTEAAIGKLIQRVIAMVDVKKLVEKISPPIEKLGKKILEIVDVITQAVAQADNLNKFGQRFSYVSREMAMAATGYGDSVKAATKDTEESIKMSDEMAKSLQAAKDIWYTGKYGNGNARISALEAAGIDTKKTQEIVDEFIQNGNDWDAAVKKVMKDTAEGTDETSEKAERLRVNVEKLGNIFYNIKRIVKNVATSVTNVLSALLSTIGEEVEDNDILGIFVKITGKVADFSDKLVITKEKADKIKKPLKVISGILSTIGKVLIKVAKGFITVIYNIGKFWVELAKSVKESETFQKIIQSIGNGIKKFTEVIKSVIKAIGESEMITKLVSGVFTIALTIFNGVVNIANKIGEVIANIIPKIEEFATSVVEFFKPLGGIVRNAFEKTVGFFEGIYDWIKNHNFIDAFRSKMSEFTSPESADKESEKTVLNIVDWFKDFLGKVADKLKNVKATDIINAVKDIAYLASVIQVVIIGHNLNSAVSKLPKLVGNFNKVIKSFAELQKSAAKMNKSIAFLNYAKGFVKFAEGVALIVGSVMLIATYMAQGEKQANYIDAAVKIVLKIMGTLAFAILGLIGVSKFADMLSDMYKSKFKLNIPMFMQFAAFLFSIGYVLKSIITAIEWLSTDDNKDKLKEGAKTIAIIFAALGGFIVVVEAALLGVSKLIGGIKGDTTKIFGQLAVLLFSIAVSVDLVVAAIAVVSGLVNYYGEDVMKKTISSITKLIIAISAGVAGILLALNLSQAQLAKFGGSMNVTTSLLALAGVFIALALALNLLIIPILSIATAIKLFPQETFISLGSVLALLVVIMTTVALTSKYASADLKKSIRSLTLFVASLGFLILAISNIATGATNLSALITTFAGLSVVLGVMIGLIAVVAKVNPNYYSMLAVTTMIFAIDGMVAALGLLDSRSTSVILAATGAVSAIMVLLMILGGVTGEMNAATMLATGGSILLICAGISALALALGELSLVNTGALKTVTLEIIKMLTAMTLMSVIVGLVPGAKLAFAVIAASMIGVAVASLMVAKAIGELVESFPNIISDMQQFAIAAGKMPGLFVKGLIDGFKEALGINSPSTKFMEIGYWCIMGLWEGFKETIASLPKKLAQLVKEKIYDPICNFFDINSPSKLMEALGGYVGDGLGIGIDESLSSLDFTSSLNSIKDSITDGLDLTSIGGIAGDGLMGGLTDSLNLDNLGIDFDLSSIGNNIPDITGAVNEELERHVGEIDWTKIYSLNDLLDDESIYERLKSIGETQLTTAYETYKEHAEFMANNATFKDYLNNLESNYGSEMAEAFAKIQNEGTDAMKFELETQLMQDWIDKRKLDEAAKAFIKDVNKSVSDAAKADFVGPEAPQWLKAINTTADAIVNIKVRDADGNDVTKGFQSAFSNTSKSLDLNVDNTSIKNNLSAVSGDISNAINSQTDKLTNKLSAIESTVTTFNNNNSSRINSILDRMTQMESAISNIQVRLDTGALVGQLTVPLDNAIGQRAARKSRG